MFNLTFRTMSKHICVLLLFCMVVLPLQAKKSDPEKKPDWAAKDISSYTEADMERLLDQWNEDDDPLPPDELPEHLRPSPSIDMSKIDTSDPEAMLKLVKKGKTLMMFVSAREGLSRHQVDDITKLWQTSLWNSHIQAERFMVDDSRAIFMFKDGSMAWDAKNFLIKQDDCKEVVIENKTYEGPASKGKAKAMGPEPKHKKTDVKEEL